MGNYFKSIKENTFTEPLLHTHIMLSMMVEKDRKKTLLGTAGLSGGASGPCTVTNNFSESHKPGLKQHLRVPGLLEQAQEK